MTRRQGARTFAVLLACTAFYVFWDAGRPFSETDDFWCAEIVTAMLESGDFVVPRFGPAADYNKPPLFYWASLPAVAALPDLEAAMRVVPGLAFCALLWLVYRELSRRCGVESALLAAGILALTYDHHHIHGFRAGVPDGLLTLEITAVFWLALRLREQPRALLAIGALLGAAFMTKTALALIPAAIAGAALWLDRREAPVRPGLLAGSVLLGLAVVLPWFAFALAREGPALLDQMFLDQIWGRFTNAPAASETGRVFGREEPLYVLRHYLTWAQPWSLLSVPAFGLLWARRGTLDAGTSRLVTLAAIWFAAILAVMSASRGAWAWYAASAHVPAAIAVALVLREFVRAVPGAPERWLWAPIAASLLLLELPLAYDPYVRTSGRVPLDPALALQLGAVAGVAALLLRVRATDRAPASPALAALLPLLVAAALALRVSGRFAWALGMELIAIAGAVVLALRFDGTAPRRAAVFSLVLVAAAYLAAPLRFAGGNRERAEIRQVRALLESGFFQDGRALERRDSLYTYVRLYQAFSDELDVRYEPRTRRLSLGEPREAGR